VKTVDNSGAEHLGYAPQDNSEPFRAKIEANTPVLDPKKASVKYLGGWFCELGHPDDKPGTPSSEPPPG
jgi:uronate dehydrogenase